MWLFYRKKKLLISILAIIFDGVITYFVPGYINNLSYFYPMLTISFIPFLCKDENNNYIMAFILGIIYDLLYSNIFLYHTVFFCALLMINHTIINHFNNSLYLFVCLAFLNIFIYDSITFSLVMISGYQSITLYDLLYKISHSILLNIVSVFVFYFLFKKHKVNT